MHNFPVVFFSFDKCADESIVRREFGVDRFSELVPALLKPGAIRVDRFLESLGCDVRLVDEALSMRHLTVEASQEVSGQAVFLSAGLVIPSEGVGSELKGLLSMVSLRAGNWTLLSDRLESEGETIRLTKSLADFGSSATEFDFELLASQARFFNSLRFERNSVTKSTVWISKGRAEAEFYRQIPESLAAFFPKMLGETETGSDHSYELELKRSFDLGRHSIQNSLQPQDWRFLQDRLLEYFATVPALEVSVDEIRNRRRYYFIEKLHERTNEFQRASHWSEMSVAFRKKTGASFLDRVESLCHKLEAVFGTKTNRHLRFSHGDLCLSNILLDRSTGSLCFVDPRGIYEAGDKYRPEEYDLAKLAQSLYGHYEFVLSGCRPSEAWSESAKEVLLAILKSRSEDFEYTLLCATSLYWSLLPLHLDRPDRILQFMFAGERLLAEAESV